jgi:septal ring factor EnvC (AmiA/AmiB activator)
MNALVKVVAPIIVVLASLGSLYFANELGKTKKSQASEIKELNGTLTSTRGKLDKTEGELNTTRKELNENVQARATAEGALTAAKADIEQKSKTITDLQGQVTAKTGELDETKKSLVTAQEESKKVQDKVAELEKQLGDANTEKLKASVKDLEGKVANLSDENKVLGQQLGVLKSENTKLVAEKEDWTTTPATVRGSISAVQDKWGFVVLNVGERDKVRRDSKFLVYRDSKLVCKLQVVSISPDCSIAEVISDYRRGEPRVGDLVLR